MQRSWLGLFAAAVALATLAAGCNVGPDVPALDASLAGGRVGSGGKLPTGGDLAATAAPASRIKPAKDAVSLATKATPSPELHVAAAQLSEQSGRVADAEGHYQKALEIDPRHAGALVGYARLKDRQNETELATRLYQCATRAHPKDASIFNDLGLCFARRRMFKESTAAFGRAIQLEPKKWLYRNNMAMVLVETGEVDAAVSHLTAVQGEAVAHYNVGYILQKKGDSQAAARHFAMALEKNSSLVEARTWLAKLGGPPAQIAASAPRIGSERESQQGATRTEEQPGSPQWGVDPARGRGAPAFPPTREFSQPAPPARQLPPVTDRPLDADWRSDPPPAGARQFEVAPLPPPTSIGRTGEGGQSNRSGIPVVRPLPPTETEELGPGGP